MEFTKEKIKELKEKYPNQKLHLVVSGVEDGRAELKSCILRTPTRQDLSYISVIRDPIKQKETLLHQIWVCGDEDFKTDDTLFLGLCTKLSGLISVKEVELKNL